MKILSIVVLALLGLVTLGLFVYLIIGAICFKVSLARKGTIKEGLKRSRRAKRKDKEHIEDYAWWNKCHAEEVSIENDGLKLVGHFIDNGSSKVALLVHGYGSYYKEMADYAQYFTRRSFAVLAIECRGHGKSEGDMVGMGWLDRLDIVKWIEFLIGKNRSYRIILFGVSMGASGVCMTLGEKLPGNVQCAIEDCGFDNVYRQFSYVYHKATLLPPKLLMKIFNSFTIRAKNFDMREGDAIKQLKKSSIPVLFIHGGKDRFVPTEMIFHLADVVPESRKEVYICQDAEHAKSYKTDPITYERKLDMFISKFFR